MAGINERERKKQIIKETTQIGIVISVIITYILGYVGSITSTDGVNVLKAFPLIGEKITSRGILGIFFPINAGAILYMLFSIVICFFMVLLMRINAENHYTYDKDAIAGTGGFMGKSDVAEYNKRYVSTKAYVDPAEEEKRRAEEKKRKAEEKKAKQEEEVQEEEVLREPVASPNMILSQEIYRDIDARKTRRNNNVLVVGGAGSGKTRFFIKPNLLQLNCCPIVTDPSGEIVDSVGKLYEECGYKVKIFNISNMKHSNCYNPFHYIRDEAGVLMLIDCFIRNTTGKGQKGDEFFTNAERLVYAACIFYLWEFEQNVGRKNLSTVLELINMSAVDERDSSKKSPLDELFDSLPFDCLANQYYRSFKQAAGKTLKSILISCVTRLQPFMIPQVKSLTKRDDLELDKIGSEKIALFIITPQADLTFSFLSSMLYSQLFETLYHVGEQKKLKTGDESLTYPVRCLMDEFANRVTRSTPKTVGITDKSVA